MGKWISLDWVHRWRRQGCRKGAICQFCKSWRATGEGYGAHGLLLNAGYAFGSILLHITPEVAAGSQLVVDSGACARLPVKERW